MRLLDLRLSPQDAQSLPDLLCNFLRNQTVVPEFQFLYVITVWYDFDMTCSCIFQLLGLLFAVCQPSDVSVAQVDSEQSDWRQLSEFVDANCVDCHSGSDAEAGLSLDEFESTFLLDLEKGHAADEEIVRALELMLRRVKSRQMPPPELEVPDAELESAVRGLSSYLDTVADRFPRVGKVSSIRRLTRTEYRNAIRDLLGMAVDVTALLPKDESSHGFDNVTVDSLSATLVSRYVLAAEKIAAAAVGASGEQAGVTIRVPADRTQERHVDGLPFGTRGGTVFEHQFHQDGEYEIEIKLTRDRDEKVEGLDQPHDLDVLLDREKVHSFKLVPPKSSNPKKGSWKDRDYTHVDSHLKKRFFVEAGSHQIGVTFPNRASSVEESKRQPFDASFNRHRHPRKTPAIFQVSIVGPFSPAGPGETKSRRLIFGDFGHESLVGKTTAGRRRAAFDVLSDFARRAYRRPVEAADIEPLMAFFESIAGTSNAGEQPAGNGDFDRGIQAAVAAVLVNPNFLLRVETQPEGVNTGDLYQISQFDLANRLSWFLWSSIPDRELLDLARGGQLRTPTVLRDQVRRMLQDDRAESLINNFADQWLHLRNLESITPDLRRYPDFDDNLRQAFRGETQALFADVLRNDKSVLQLVASNYTFLNQRLATHYGIAGVQGSHFRKVALSPAIQPERIRGGILRHGSVLMVTSYATRTSPTIRGNWVLENILGTPAPPPPPNVPNLKENTQLHATSIRQRLAQHRKDPACASCHNLMDPVGFSLENYDVVGRWRDFEDGLPVDSAGRLPDGTEIHQLDDLEQGILNRPEMFVTAMAEKLLTFAIGRGVEPFDGPAVRAIVKEAAKNEYRLSSLVIGIVESKPFQMRSAQ